MNPRVRYTKAPDGVHIAYWEHGEGPPMVYMPTIPFSRVQLELDVPECRKWYERLIASGRTLVRYDARGTGSDRDVTYFTIEACMRDLEGNGRRAESRSLRHRLRRVARNQEVQVDQDVRAVRVGRVPREARASPRFGNAGGLR